MVKKTSTKIKSKKLTKPKTSSKVKSKVSSKINPKEKLNKILINLINNPIHTSVITSLGGAGTFAATYIYKNYGEYALHGYTKELKQFNKHDYKILKPLFEDLSFKYYMDSGLQFARENYRLDKEKIKEYNDAFPKNKIESFYQYVKNNGKEYEIKKKNYMLDATRPPPETMTQSMENLFEPSKSK